MSARYWARASLIILGFLHFSQSIAGNGESHRGDPLKKAQTEETNQQIDSFLAPELFLKVIEDINEPQIRYIFRKVSKSTNQLIDRKYPYHLHKALDRLTRTIINKTTPEFEKNIENQVLADIFAWMFAQTENETFLNASKRKMVRELLSSHFKKISDHFQQQAKINFTKYANHLAFVRNPNAYLGHSSEELSELFTSLYPSRGVQPDRDIFWGLVSHDRVFIPESALPMKNSPHYNSVISNYYTLSLTKASTNENMDINLDLEVQKTIWELIQNLNSDAPEPQARRIRLLASFLKYPKLEDWSRDKIREALRTESRSISPASAPLLEYAKNPNLNAQDLQLITEITKEYYHSHIFSLKFGKQLIAIAWDSLKLAFPPNFERQYELPDSKELFGESSAKILVSALRNLNQPHIQYAFTQILDLPRLEPETVRELFFGISVYFKSDLKIQLFKKLFAHRDFKIDYLISNKLPQTSNASLRVILKNMNIDKNKKSTLIAGLLATSLCTPLDKELLKEVQKTKDRPTKDFFNVLIEFRRFMNNT